MTLLLWNVLAILGALSVAAIVVGIVLFIRWGNQKSAALQKSADARADAEKPTP